MRLRALGFAKASVRQDVRAAQAALGRVQLVARIIAQARATDVLDARQLAEIIAQGVAVRAQDLVVGVGAHARELAKDVLEHVILPVQNHARKVAPEIALILVLTGAITIVFLAAENAWAHATDALDALVRKLRRTVVDGAQERANLIAVLVQDVQALEVIALHK